MKKITIKYPDDMQEDEIGYYLPATFNNGASHYKEMKPNKEPNNITYSNDRQAILTRSTTGYTLEFISRDKEAHSDGV